MNQSKKLLESTLPISPIEEVLEDIRQGKMIILVDDADRENEGDLTIATEKITPEILSFMMREARGLICTSISHELAQQLNLPLQVRSNSSAFQTPFTVTIDHREVIGSGLTARGRCHTMQRMLKSDVAPDEFVSPGHVYPLIANPSGVFARQGQTEGSFDLARLAGLAPSGVICEILNPDGTMARNQKLIEFSQRHQLKITSVAEIIRYRSKNEVYVRKGPLANLPTDFGEFAVHVFQDDSSQKEHLALVLGDLTANGDQAPILRIHSECLTGDVFGSRRCDCGGQLEMAMQQIVAEGRGVLLYLRQEGRGIGLFNKLRAYELQDEGHDTVEANVRLGFEPDPRDFVVAARMLEKLEIKKVRLLTNNPRKVESLASCGIEVQARLSVVTEPDHYSQEYLRCKKDKLGHLLT